MNDNCLYAITITPISLTYVKIISTLSTKRVDSWIAGNRTEPADSSASDDSGPGPFSVFPFSLREEERTAVKGGTFSPPFLGADAPIHLFTYRYSFVFSFRGLLCSGGQQLTKQNRPLQFGTRLLGPLCRLYGQVNHVTIHTVHLRRRSQLNTKK